MFRQHFELKYNPFDKEISTDKLFSSRDTKELDSRLKYMLDNRGICLIVGEPVEVTSISQFSLIPLILLICPVQVFLRLSEELIHLNSIILTFLS